MPENRIINWQKWDHVRVLVAGHFARREMGNSDDKGVSCCVPRHRGDSRYRVRRYRFPGQWCCNPDQRVQPFSFARRHQWSWSRRGRLTGPDRTRARVTSASGRIWSSRFVLCGLLPSRHARRTRPPPRYPGRNRRYLVLRAAKARTPRGRRVGQNDCRPAGAHLERSGFVLMKKPAGPPMTTAGHSPKASPASAPVR